MIVVLTTIYNCENYLKRCVDSILSQENTDWMCYLLDDMSTDWSPHIANGVALRDKRFIYIKNEDKLYQPGNYDNIIRDNPDIKNEDIIVEVDGDDWLPDNLVFSRVLDYYADGNTWITYGQFKYSTGKEGFANVVDTQVIRRSIFTASHLRTWKAFLWRNIHQDDLKVNGSYAETAGDMFFMIPMLEMATNKHAKFVEDVNYIYNEENPLNDHKGVRARSQRELALVGRSRNSYPPLER